MHVLQCGRVKSGNFWLYSILQKVLDHAEIEAKSFIQNQPIHELVRTWSLSYKEQADIDVLDITQKGCFYRISSIFRHPVENLEDYIQQSRHVWTHSEYTARSNEVLKKFDGQFYLIRDPRDVALSMSRFVFTPYMQKYYPTQYGSPEEYLENRLEGMCKGWLRHVGPYLKHKDELGLHVVFYEQLLYGFDRTLKRMVDYLDISLSGEAQATIREATTFGLMKEENPEHVQKGKAGKWMDKLTDDQKSVL